MHVIRHNNPRERIHYFVVMQSTHFFHHATSTVEIGKMPLFSFAQYCSYKIRALGFAKTAFKQIIVGHSLSNSVE